MKVRICVNIELDQDKWAKYNNIPLREVREDVKDTVPLFIEQQFREIPQLGECTVERAEG